MKVAAVAVTGLAIVLLVGTRQSTKGASTPAPASTPLGAPEQPTRPASMSGDVKRLLGKVDAARKRMDAPAQIRVADADVIGKPMTSYDRERHAELISTWVQFAGQAHLTNEQEDKILRIVWDVQEDLRQATDASWADFTADSDPARFAEFEGQKHDVLQADLDARIRTVLDPAQAELYQNESTLSIRAIDLFGPLVEPQK